MSTPKAQTTVTPQKKNTSFRFSNRGLDLMGKLADIYGLSEQASIELLLRRCFRSDCDDLKNPTLIRLVEKAREASTPMDGRTMGISTEGRDLLERMSDQSGRSRAEVVELCVFGAAVAEGLI